MFNILRIGADSENCKGGGGEGMGGTEREREEKDSFTN